MKKYMLKGLLKGKQKRIMLVIELFFSFIAFFFILSFIVRQIDNAEYPLGFDYTNLYKIDLDITVKTDNQQEIRNTVKEITDYIRYFPGVQNIGKCQSSFFFSQGYMNPSQPLKSNGMAIPANQINQMLATDDVAEVLDLKVLEGRWFSVEDNASRNRPVVLTQNLKEQFFGNANALGEIVDYCGQQCIIVGVCNNLKHKGDYTQPEYTIFIRNVEVENLQYETWMCMNGSNCGYNILLKGEANLPIPFEQDLARKIAVKYPGYNLRILDMKEIRRKYIRGSWAPLLIVLLLISALFLNVLFGLFGVLWYNISQRKSEIGLRIAVGANKMHIYQQFVEEMLLLATVAIVPGIIVAAQFPFFNLFNIETRIYIIAMLLSALVIYLMVSLCALLPSARATKTQPAIALHEE